MGFSEEDKQFITQLITEQTAELTRRLAESDAKVSDLARQLNESRSEVRSLKRQVEDSNIFIDDLEQYGRRMSVRVENVPFSRGETENDLFTKIHTKLAEVDVNINLNDVVRFHRSSAPKVNEDGSTVAQCIVKFGKWEARRSMHGLNKKARAKQVSVRVNNDLTRRLFSLLLDARRKMKDSNILSNECFPYADMNSNLRIRIGGVVKTFNTDTQLDTILADN